MQLALKRIAIAYGLRGGKWPKLDPADPSCLGSGCVSVRTDIDCDRRKSLQNSRNRLLYQP